MVPNQSFCKHCETHRKCSTRPACKGANYQSKNENLIHDDGIKEEINKSVKKLKYNYFKAKNTNEGVNKLSAECSID